MGIRLDFVRLAFPNLWEPKAIQTNGVENGSPRYTVNAILPAGADGDRMAKQVIDEIMAAYSSKWPDPKTRPYMSAKAGERASWFNKNHSTQQKSTGLRVPLVWGPSEWPDDENCAENWVMILASPAKANIIIVERPPGAPAPIQVQDRAKVYPGAEAHVYTGIFGYTQSGSSGIGAGIDGVFLTGRDLGRFDSKPSVDAMFGDLPAMPGAAPAPNDAPWD